MTDHMEAAIDAARTACAAHFFGPTRNEFDEITCAECGYAFGWDGLGKGPRGDRALNHAFDQALAAAEPHLRKKWAEELERAMFKVESVHHFGFGEYGIKCLCGFESSRSRSRTEHITQAVRGLLEGAGE